MGLELAVFPTTTIDSWSRPLFFISLGNLQLARFSSPSIEDTRLRPLIQCWEVEERPSTHALTPLTFSPPPAHAPLSVMLG